MSKISDKLENKPGMVKNIDLIDYVISLQLNKIEDYSVKSKESIDVNSENAMNNLCELINIRSQIYKK